jgi:hypothetical protein
MTNYIKHAKTLTLDQWRGEICSGAEGEGPLWNGYVLVAFDDRSVGLLSHADGSGLLPEARPKLTALSWEEIRLALMLDIGSN